MRLAVIILTFGIGILTGYALFKLAAESAKCGISFSEGFQVARKNLQTSFAIARFNARINTGFNEHIELPPDAISYARLKPAKNACLYFGGAYFYLLLSKGEGYESGFTDEVDECQIKAEAEHLVFGAAAKDSFLQLVQKGEDQLDETGCWYEVTLYSDPPKYQRKYISDDNIDIVRGFFETTE